MGRTEVEVDGRRYISVSEYQRRLATSVVVRRETIVRWLSLGYLPGIRYGGIRKYWYVEVQEDRLPVPERNNE